MTDRSPEEIIARALWDRSEKVTFPGYPIIPWEDAPKAERTIRKSEAAAITAALKDSGMVVVEQKELQRSYDEIDGLRSDLDSALEVMKKRATGEKPLSSMRTWLEQNYPGLLP